VGVTHFKVPYWHFPGRTEENHEKPQLRQTATESIFEPRTS
jgi:hypothetical protein